MRKFAIQDRVRHPHHGTGRVEAIGVGRLTVRLDSGRVVDFSDHAVQYEPDAPEIEARKRLVREFAQARMKARDAKYADGMYLDGEDGL